MNARHLLPAACCAVISGCSDAPLRQDDTGSFRVVELVEQVERVSTAIAERDTDDLLILAHDERFAQRAAEIPDRRWPIVAVASRAFSSLRANVDAIVEDDPGGDAAVEVALLWCHGVTPPHHLLIGTRIVRPGDAAGGAVLPAPGDFVLRLLRHEHRALLGAGAGDVVFRIGLLTQALGGQHGRVREQVASAVQRQPQLVLAERDAGGDGAAMTVLARELLASGCRALLVSSDDPAALAPLATEVQQQNVALIVFDPLGRCAEATCNIGCDPVLLGRALAQAVKELRPAGASIVELGGQDAALRPQRESFDETLGFRERT